MYRYTFLSILLLQSAACATVQEFETDTCAKVPINQIQQIGSHNSYRLRPPPSVLEAIDGVLPGFRERVEYQHPPLDTQLDLGLRLLEIDLYADPSGGQYASPPNLELLRPDEPLPFRPGVMESPGFKVLHMQGYDNYSNCLTLEDCLRALSEWSLRNPDHSLITVTLNLKQDQPFPGTLPPPTFSSALLGEMDEMLLTIFGSKRIFRPDDFRGDAPTLRSAVLAKNWPIQSELNGKFMFVIDEESPSAMLQYREGYPSLEGRLMWATFPETEDEAAFINVWDVFGQEARIARLVRDGFIVRAAADIGTIEARQDDHRRLNTAIDLGVQFIASDFYPGNTSGIQTRYAATFENGKLAQCRRQ